MKILSVFVLVMLMISDATFLKKCPEDWKVFGRKCYKFINEGRPWAEAERHCQDLGGNLASVHSNQTHFLLQKMARRSSIYKRTWIGAQDATQNSVWLWSDGSVFDFSIWHSGEPNHEGGEENCVEMNYGDELLWNDARCNTKLAFMCQKVPNHCGRL